MVSMVNEHSILKPRDLFQSHPSSKRLGLKWHRAFKLKHPNRDVVINSSPQAIPGCAKYFPKRQFISVQPPLAKHKRHIFGDCINAAFSLAKSGNVSMPERGA